MHASNDGSREVTLLSARFTARVAKALPKSAPSVEVSSIEAHPKLVRPHFRPRVVSRGPVFRLRNDPARVAAVGRIETPPEVLLKPIRSADRSGPPDEYDGRRERERRNRLVASSSPGSGEGLGRVVPRHLSIQTVLRRRECRSRRSTVESPPLLRWDSRVRIPSGTGSGAVPLDHSGRGADGAEVSAEGSWTGGRPFSSSRVRRSGGIVTMYAGSNRV